MDKLKRGVIIGMVCGDGYVQVRTRYNGTVPYVSRNIRVLHGANQRAYCEWKARRLSWALGGQRVNVTRVRNGPGGRYTAYQFSKNHPYFGQVRQWCYPDGKKTFTPRMLDMLTPEGVAIWYMDDGSARVNVNSQGWVSSVATDIATMCSEQEVDTIIDWFKHTHDIAFKKRYSRKCAPDQAFFVQANTAESKKFARLIAPYVPDCMLYKLRHVADLQSHECRAPVGYCVKCATLLYDNRRKGMCIKCYTQERTQTQQKDAQGDFEVLAAELLGDDIVRPTGNAEPVES